MNRQATLINLNDWEEFGGGFTAKSYYHKTDDSVMMKLYAPFMPPEEGYNELCCAEEVYKMGIPTAKSLEYVTDGTRFGAIFERVKNKKSIARLLADDPEHLDSYAKILATELKKLHSMKCTSDYFPDVAERMISNISKAEFIPKKDRDQAIDIIRNTPKCNTCLHGDMHIGNMIIADDKPLFIDLGDFAWGNPLFDLGQLFFSSHSVDEKITMNLYHITTETYKRFWDKFAEYYFEDLTDLDAKLLPYKYLTVVKYSAKIGNIQDEFQIIMDEYNNR